ncbi:MAG TPA: hypothetical protein VH000_00675 [Rhizomicrobium sp.]|jgi:hypothetical protein|nr:hypothetical protein [Rhizomicrobium sp.]
MASAATAQELNPSLSGIGFLVGHWNSGVGKVADTGGTSKGSSDVTVEAGGAALLRKDHTEFFDSQGKPSGSFDQIMLIYPEDGAIHADYTDGQHVIHYTSAVITAGQSVTFASAPGRGPAFSLSYNLQAPDTLAISFGMIPPGQAMVHSIASGTLKKSN